MPHIDLPAGLPGIIGLLAYRPTTAKPLSELAEVLLRSDNSLSRGERELIAAYVSSLNECQFCDASHSTFAAAQLADGMDVVRAVKHDLATAPVSPKLRALLAIAAKVHESGRRVTEEDIAAARAEGATDVELHDTVLIAAAFCMYNRYVDGLGTWAPTEQADYDAAAALIVDHGYIAALTPPPV
ncbi:MAG: hypothetical protein QOI55_1304 [Actinomycetota bacterium]|jgi:uncharacterized peroxidase-related enzyme|nr:hypothetical protein [Actinomycetota bacterium]